MSARSLLERRDAGLAEAERIRLEDHLGTCAACRTEQRRRAKLRALADLVPAPALTGVARERVLARALDGAFRDTNADDPGPAPRHRRTLAQSSGRAALVVAPAVAAAVAVAAALWIGSEAGPPATPDGLLRPSDRLRSGDLSAEGRSIMPGLAVPSSVVLQTEEGALLELGTARVELGSAARARWERRIGTLALEAGLARVSVEPSAASTFRVATSRFVAEVAGTEFEVDLSGVRVSRGVVRVTSPDGALLAVLRAGEIFRAGEPESAIRSRVGEPGPAIGSLASGDTGREPPARAALETPAATLRASPAERGPSLAEARSALARGEVTAARALLKRALGLRLPRTEEAEARTLLADAAAVAGETDNAIDLYVEVARRFADLPAGEAALFAAARTASGRGPERARALLADYLTRYPEGRFRREVEARLRALGERAP